MAKTVIKVENVSKVYRLGEIGTGSLGSDINRWWVTKVLGGEDPYLRIGQTNDRATKGDSDVVYSLRDVSFEVQQGEVLGIIGKNGAGKSTLLKILSRITAPTTGRVKMKGRVASLLEVGTGFHPELTGRENIFLNGSILGMRKHEIARKLDEIIDFSGVERYIDTPVKRYSSGMYVRLAFAVAAHLESEILIVDEVLAVGDAEFQKKCLGRMKDVSTNEGRTVLFVSHNMASLLNVCSLGLLLKNGCVFKKGDINDVVSHYLADTGKNSDKFIPSNNSLRIDSFDLSFDIKKNEKETTTVYVKFKLSIFSDGSYQNVAIGIGVDDKHNNRLVTFYSHYLNQYFNFEKGLHQLECIVENWPLRFGKYYLVFSLVSNGLTIDSNNQGVSFDYLIEDSYLFEYSNRMDNTQGFIIAKQKWITL